MKRKPTLLGFKRAINKVAKLLIAEIQRELRTAKKGGVLKKAAWISAFLDARWISDGDGLGWKSKVRIELPDQKMTGIHLTRECNQLLDRIGQTKNEVFADKWYGLKLTVYPDGKHQYELNHDPECYVNDPQWYYT